MEVEIRAVRPEDLFYIIEMEERIFGADAFSFNYLFYLYENCREFFLIADYKGVLVGYVVSCRESEELHVHSIAVAEWFRGKGVGRRLMEETLRLARLRGLKRVRLEVKTENTVAISLYEKLGFERKAYLKSYYADGSDAYVYVLNLQ
ncbi:ribosomal protein S18-alanine N-acetyltransferase [Infirmifilum sp. NZ]|uniref:ribosomal protein S18-alanine N-acetyltransferase n=1 Tax=Infirmifilum sp. NZ TaxID=2926850 RepID=UPI000CBEE4B3|nr:ribosomal protein S18-alanine N-acetyltransferase [Infirmifilum sp. NZ]PLJ78256.1 MAG: ribosomal-protein-alanine N-acetyltransferase [Thermofilum sp. NZ13]UNQ72901.1 ribosomal protein S18-alanine N-acetyltransferase [Infirmifilum sp. NZ]